MQGRLNEAKMSLNDLEAMAPSGMSKSEQLSARLRARFLTASGDTEKALEILARLEQLDRREEIGPPADGRPPHSSDGLPGQGRPGTSRPRF